MVNTLATAFSQSIANAILVVPLGIPRANVGGGAGLPHQKGGDTVSDARTNVSGNQQPQ